MDSVTIKDNITVNILTLQLRMVYGTYAGWEDILKAINLHASGHKTDHGLGDRKKVPFFPLKSLRYTESNAGIRCTGRDGQNHILDDAFQDFP